MKTKINPPSTLNIYLPIILSVFVILFLSVFFIRPKIQDITIGNSNIRQTKERLEKLNKKINRLQKIDQDSLKEKNTLLKECLPITKNIPQGLNTLENIAGETKVNLLLIRVNPGEISTPSATANIKLVKTFKDSYQLEITAQGDYQDLIKFLEKVNNTNPIITIEQGIINFGINKETETKLASLQLNLLAYFYPEIKSLGKISDPLPSVSKDEEDIYQKITKFENRTVLVDFIPTGKKNPFVLVE